MYPQPAMSGYYAGYYGAEEEVEEEAPAELDAASQWLAWAKNPDWLSIRRVAAPAAVGVALGYTYAGWGWGLVGSVLFGAAVVGIATQAFLWANHHGKLDFARDWIDRIAAWF